MKVTVFAIAMLIAIGASAPLEAAKSYARWYKSKRAKNNEYAVFSAENGPFAKIYIVARRKGRYFVDLLYDRKGKPRLSAAFWSPDNRRVALQLSFEGRRLVKEYDVSVVEAVRELDRNPERYLVQLGWVDIARRWGWPKARLAGLAAVTGLVALPRGTLAWYLAAARFYEKGGYLARFLLTLHLRSSASKPTAFDPKLRDGDVLARLTTALLLRFEGCKARDSRLLQKLNNAFPGRGIAFYLGTRKPGAGTRLMLGTHPRNRWEAKKLADFLRADPSLLLRTGGGSLTVETRSSASLPLHEITLELR